MRRKLRSVRLNDTVFAADGCRQSFYVTLDISSAADYHHPRSKKKNPVPPRPKSPQSAMSLAPTSPVAQDDAVQSEPPESPIAEIPTHMDIDPTLGQPEEDDSLSEPEDRLQILDLHRQNPLVSYGNRMYSCEWTSTLGTDLLLTAPTPDFPHSVLREKPNVSVLAASSIKLMGRPAKLASRHGTEEGGQPSTPAPENPITSANTASAEKAAPVKITLGPAASRARQKQAKFLERLIAIKAKKGEKDNVTVYSQKVNQGTGWRSQRKASEAMEDGEDETTPKQSRRGRGTGGRPLGSRRRRGPRTAKGGLFRDYRPRLWDTPGADIRAGPSSTPESWDQLEGETSDGRETPTVTTPLPIDHPAQTANGSARSLSASASANPSPTPPFRPLQTVNDEPMSSTEQATPNPSLALSLEPQPPTVMGESEVPPSRSPDAGPLQRTQTEGIATEMTPAPDTATGTLESPGMAAAADDVEMEDA